jgi:hypothetical protein
MTGQTALKKKTNKTYFLDSYLLNKITMLPPKEIEKNFNPLIGFVNCSFQVVYSITCVVIQY